MDFQAINLDEEFKAIDKIKGKSRASSVGDLYVVISQKEGEDRLFELQKELKAKGCKIYELEDSMNLEWVDHKDSVKAMLAAARKFNWMDEDLIDLGRRFAKNSAQFTIFVKIFLSLKATLKIAAKGWNNHYDEGEVKIVECDTKEKIVKIQLHNFVRHRVHCLFLQGIFIQTIEMAIGPKEFAYKETKCMLDGDPYHEFVITWK